MTVPSTLTTSSSYKIRYQMMKASEYHKNETSCSFPAVVCCALFVSVPAVIGKVVDVGEPACASCADHGDARVRCAVSLCRIRCALLQLFSLGCLEYIIVTKIS